MSPKLSSPRTTNNPERLCPVKIRDFSRAANLTPGIFPGNEIFECDEKCRGSTGTVVKVRRIGGIVGNYVDRPAEVCPLTGEAVVETLWQALINAPRNA